MQAAAARFLKQSTSINVWLELVVPDSHDGHTGDMFQVWDGTLIFMPQLWLLHHLCSCPVKLSFAICMGAMSARASNSAHAPPCILFLCGALLFNISQRCSGGMGQYAQVKAELTSADGRVAASTSRPCMITYRSPLVRSIRCARAPCRAA